MVEPSQADELVRVKRKPEAKDKEVVLTFKCKCCTVTPETLQEPIVTFRQLI